jgi:hypothetical protein
MWGRGHLPPFDKLSTPLEKLTFMHTEGFAPPFYITLSAPPLTLINF